MQVDGFTFVAQIINFLILLYLLYRFLYGPILEVMEAREQKISKRLSDAQETKSSAEQLETEYRQKLENLEDQRQEKLAEMEEEIAGKRRQKLEQVRGDIEERRQEWQAALLRSKSEFIRDLRQQIGAELSQALRKALQDLANIELEEHIRNVFMQKLEQVEAQEKQRVRNLLAETDQPIYLLTAHQVDPSGEEQLKTAVRESLLDHQLEHPITIEQAPELINGIELEVKSYRLAWSLQSYVDQLEENLDRYLRARVDGEEHVQPGKRDNGQKS